MIRVLRTSLASTSSTLHTSGKRAERRTPRLLMNVRAGRACEANLATAAELGRRRLKTRRLVPPTTDDRRELVARYAGVFDSTGYPKGYLDVLRREWSYADVLIAYLGKDGA
jgi:hypothetical protein